MKPFLLFLMLPFVFACAAQPKQSPTATAVSNQVYAAIIKALPGYRLHSRQKALAACIQWPTAPGEPIFVDTLGGFALADQSDGKFSPGAVVQGAIRDCQGNKAGGQFDCKCQILDVSGSNRLIVPTTVPSTDHPLTSRKSKIQPRKGARGAKPSGKNVETNPRCDLVDCEVEGKNVRAAGDDYSPPAGRSGATCPPITCEKNEMGSE